MKTCDFSILKKLILTVFLVKVPYKLGIIKIEIVFHLLDNFTEKKKNREPK